MQPHHQGPIWHPCFNVTSPSRTDLVPLFQCNPTIKDRSGTAVSVQPQHQGPIWHRCFCATPTSRIDLAPEFRCNPNIKDRFGTTVSLQPQHQGPIRHRSFVATPTSRTDLALLIQCNPIIKDRSGGFGVAALKKFQEDNTIFRAPEILFAHVGWTPGPADARTHARTDAQKQ